jgi:hypothetical protein
MTKPKHQDDIILDCHCRHLNPDHILTRRTQMSYLSELRKFYPKSWKARIAIQRYNTHLEWEHKTQRLSPSTNRRSTTGVQKKVDGITTLDTPASPIASSPRSKQSKSISSTQKSTKSGTSPTSGSRRRTRTTTSVTPTTTPSSIPQNVLTTVETL